MSSRTLIIIIAIALAAALGHDLLTALIPRACAEERSVLNACEAMLAARYEACKAESMDMAEARNLCSAQASTRLCGFSWGLSYGDFISLRIEEEALINTGLTGLLKREDRYVASH